MEKEIFESIPENFSRKDMKEAADGKVTDTTLDYYLKSWISRGLIEKTGYGKYHILSEWKEPVKYLPNRTEEAKAIRAYIRKKYNSVCEDFKFENINVLQINKDSIIFQVKIIVPLIEVLLMSEALYGLKDCFVEGCIPTPSITGYGEVVYENVILQCSWSDEKMEIAKKLLRKR